MWKFRYYKGDKKAPFLKRQIICEGKGTANRKINMLYYKKTPNPALKWITLKH